MLKRILREVGVRVGKYVVNAVVRFKPSVQAGPVIVVKNPCADDGLRIGIRPLVQLLQLLNEPEKAIPSPRTALLALAAALVKRPIDEIVHRAARKLFQLTFPVLAKILHAARL